MVTQTTTPIAETTDIITTFLNEARDFFEGREIQITSVSISSLEMIPVIPHITSFNKS